MVPKSGGGSSRDGAELMAGMEQELMVGMEGFMAGMEQGQMAGMEEVFMVGMEQGLTAGMEQGCRDRPMAGMQGQAECSGLLLSGKDS